jgi:hypothetical protein
LPEGWPLDWLTPPAEARRAELTQAPPPEYGDAYVVKGQPFNLGSKEEGRLWRVGFTLPKAKPGAPGVFEELTSLTEENVKARGYYLYFNEDNAAREGREYISPDGRYVVQIYHFKASGLLHMQVSEYAQGWNGGKPVKPDST